MKQPGFLRMISRRYFLKILSIEVGMLALGGCKTVASNQAHIEMTPTAIAIPSSTPRATPQLAATERLAATAVPQSENKNPAAFLPENRSAGETFALPQPRLSESMPLMTALSQRRSIRSFLPDDLPVATLADLLWAGFGVNRPQSGLRTAPSAHNMQDIHIYVATSRGLWRYEAARHSLTAVLAEDVRGLTQPPGEAPVNLIYVSRYPTGSSEEEMLPWSWAHSGFIAQNVYLYCAAAGLATVVRSSFSRPPLAKRMGLQTNEHITLVQTIGLHA